MKKSFTRALSLLLVLVMILGVMPMALANTTGDGDPEPDPTTVDVTGINLNMTTVTLNIGGTAALTATVAPENATDKTVTWSSNASSVATVDSNGVVTAVGGGTATITATAHDGSGVTATCAVTVNYDDPSGVTVTPDAVELFVGEEDTLTATVAPTTANQAVTWSSSDPTKVSVTSGGKIKGLAATTSAVTITATAVDGTTTGTASVTVNAAQYTVAATPATKTLAPTETLNVALSIKKDGAAVTNTDLYDVEGWKSDKTDVATVTPEGVVTAVANGIAYITNKVTFKETGESHTATCVVTVANGTITCSNGNAPIGSTITLSPTYSGGNDTVDFSFEVLSTGKRGTVALVDNGNTATVSGGSTISAAEIKITAKLKGTENVVGTKNIAVGFYDTNDVDVTMYDKDTTLLFMNSNDIKESGSLRTQILYGNSSLISSTDRIYFTNLSDAEGKLSDDDVTLTLGNYTTVGSMADKLTFTVGSKGTATFNYSIRYGFGSYSDVVLQSGSIEIVYNGSLDTVEYNGTTGSKVYMDEDDFYAFWKRQNVTGDFSYIKIEKKPEFGTLYTSQTGTTLAYEASVSDRFHYNYSSSRDNSSYDNDLDTLTYSPSTTKKEAHDIVIPFTAYGETSGQTASGKIIIHMNAGDNKITPRGVFFGTVYDKNGTTTTTDDLTYSDQIADNYKALTGETLGHVVFDLPAAEKGQLFRKITDSAVVNGTKLGRSVELYHNPSSSSKADLDDAAFIPAAGFSGKVTLTYTAYDINGNNSKSGSIVFNVVTSDKSAVFSDVNAKSYKWAADSVDFLYYEGVAQGSNGKYNPSANITRGDFMLMLYRAFLEEAYGTFTVTTNFPDVVKGTSTYSKETYQAVGVAKYLGIAQGTNDRFNPKSNITRQEAMVLIYRTLDTLGRELDYSSGIKATSFKDYTKVSSWAATAITNLVAHGVVTGTNDYIKPLANITRAEMACILHRVITY